LWKALLSIVKLSAKGPTDVNQISEESKTSIEVVKNTLSDLTSKDLIETVHGKVTTSSRQRVDIAMMALREGADPESVCKYLGWTEFEEVAAIALEANRFFTKKHVHFRSTKGRFEIDVLGFLEPTIVSVDCKHWKRSWQRAATARMVEAQLLRTGELAKLLPELKEKLGISRWKKAKLMPVVLTLSDTPFKVHNGVPVVSVHRFQNFLSDLPSYEESLVTINIDLPSSIRSAD